MNKKILISVCCILAAYLVAVGARIEKQSVWKKYPEAYTYKGDPLLLTFDGYHYLVEARALERGSYGKLDPKSRFPEGAPRVYPPPLLSELTVMASHLFNLSLLKAAFYLPCFLGPLLVAFVYLTMLEFADEPSATAAALVSGLSTYFLFRSSTGWYDTDSLNVVCLFALSYFALKFSKEKEMKSYIWLAAYLLTTAIYWLWWDQARSTVVILSLAVLGSSMLFLYRPEKKKLMTDGGIAVALLFIALVFSGFDSIEHIVSSSLGQLHYVTKTTAFSPWPEVGKTISEQTKPTYQEVVVRTLDSSFLLWLSVVGFALYVFKRKKEAAPLVIPTILSLLGAFYAKRFLIFTAPILGLGLGMLVFYASSYLKDSPYKFVPWLLAALLALPIYYQGKKFVYGPKLTSPYAKAYSLFGQISEKNAVLWTWWDYGYAARFFSDRAVIGDGKYHSGRRNFFLAFPMTSPSPEVSRYWMKFFAVHGQEGFLQVFRELKDYEKAKKAFIEIFAKPEDFTSLAEKFHLKEDRSFFFPESPPVYLSLDDRMLKTAYFWSWFGNWDFKTRKSKRIGILKLTNARDDGKQVLASNGYIDIENGTAEIYGKKTFKLYSFFRTGDPESLKTYDSGTVAALSQVFARRAFLLNKTADRSIFSKLLLYYGLFSKDFEDTEASVFPMVRILKVK